MNHMKSQMDDLAQNVSPVDLTPRIHATARKLRKTRAIAAGVATLALATGAAFGGTFALSEDNGAAGKLHGRFVFGGPTEGIGAGRAAEVDLDEENAARSYTVITWTPEQTPVTHELPGAVFESTVAVSPDGELLSYVGDDHAVHLVDLDTGDDSVLAGAKTQQYPMLNGEEYEGTSENAPVWSHDSKRLWIDSGDKGSQRYGFVDIDSGEFSPTHAPPGGNTRVVHSDNGDKLVSLRDSDSADGLEVVSQPIDGGDIETVVSADQFDGEYIYNLAASDPDGARLCLGLASEDLGDMARTEGNDCGKIVTGRPGAEFAADPPTTSLASISPTHLMIGEGDQYLEKTDRNEFKLRDSDKKTLDTVHFPGLLKESVNQPLSYTAPTE